MKIREYIETHETNAAAERHRALLELNNAIITNLTEETLLGAICVALKSVIHFDQAGLSIHEPEQEAMRLVALDGTSEAYFKLDQLLPLRDPVTGSLWEFHRQQFHPDLEHERRHAIDQRIYDGGNRSYICAPLIHHGQACGTLGIGSRQKNQYTRDDLEFLQEVANQIALAVANMRAYADIKALSSKEAATAEQRRVLLEINNALINSLTQDDLLGAVSTAMKRAMPFDVGGLQLYESGIEALRVFSLVGDEYANPFAPGQLIPFKDGGSGQVLDFRRPQWERDLTLGRRHLIDQQIYDAGIRSYCMAPLVLQEEFIGTLGIGSINANQYTEADLEFLQEIANQIALAVANMKAFAEIKALSARESAIADRHRTLLEINNAIITCLTQEELLRSIGAALQRVVPFNQAGMYLYYPEKDIFRFFSLYRTDHVEPYIVEQELDPKDSVSGLVFAQGRAMVRGDLETERQFSSEEHLYQKGVRSMCVAPLIVQGKTIGTIGLGSDVRNQYAEADAEFLQEVANQIALAVSNLRSYEEITALSRRETATAERRRTLLEINNAIATRLTQQELCDAVFAALERIIPFDRVGLSLFDYEQDCYHIIALGGALGGQTLSEAFTVGQRISRQENWVTEQFNIGQPWFRPDLVTGARNPFEQQLFSEGLRSFCAVPLLAQGKVIGAFSVSSQTRNQYSGADVELLQEVANQVAIAIANMQHYEEMMQEAIQRQRTEEMLRAITEGTAATTGVDFFTSLARHLATALQIRFALVAECIGHDKGRVRTLAFWQGDRFGDNFEYDLTDTPCKGVIEGRVCYYPSNVQNHFPNDADLRELGAESYLGVTIFDTAGQAVGHLAVMDDKAMADDPWRVSVLKTFAARAGAELERLRAEMALRAALDEVESLTNRLQAENLYLQEEIRTDHNFDDIIGNSPALHVVLRQVEMIAPLDSVVLILGETGTGKELVARAIHDRSARKDRPLVKVNCGAISAGLVESELFGHVKGAFTGAVDKRVGRFELADGGTMFLDEVGELPPETQVKLLRVLQEGEFEPVGSNQTRRVNVRIIAATNRNLEDEIQKGRFRADLFYRLNVLPIQLPPLRQRMEDLPKLVGFFLSRFARKMGRKINGVSQETMERLKRYSWPGNVRKLQNVIERAVALTSGAVLTIGSDLAPPAIHSVLPAAQTNGHVDVSVAPPESSSSPATGVSRSHEDVERDHILAVLNQTGWVVEGAKGAAKILSLNPNTLRSRMKKLGITRPNRRDGPTSI